MLEMEPLPFYI